MQRAQQLIQVTRAVQAAIDKTWIPEELAGSRFFSVEDIWIFIPEWSDTTCKECKEFALGIPFIPGSQLRSSFPAMEIESENEIAANVHPNCRCKLIREGTEQPKEVLSQEEAKEAFLNKR